MPQKRSVTMLPPQTCYIIGFSEDIQKDGNGVALPSHVRSLALTAESLSAHLG